MKRTFKQRKGAFFSLDALVALSIILAAFATVMSISPEKAYQNTEYQQMHYLADDAIQIFSNTKFYSINETIRNDVMSNTNLSSEDMNKSLVDIAGLLWSMNKTGYAAKITKDFFSPLLPGMNYSLKISENGKDSLIYSSTGGFSNNEIRKRHTSVFRIVSGYKENSPYTGFVARAFAAGAAKKTQSYVYFGGFEGNGNITKILTLPSVIGAINETYIELDTASNFTLFINGAYSGMYNITARVPLRAKNWTVPSEYNANLLPGINNITLSFPNINYAYVGGGFMRVKYNTTLMDTSDTKMNADGNITERYYFPGIDGLINIYSSFYVPGALKSMGIRLHYLSNYTVYLIVGNTSVYENSTNATQIVYLNNSYLRSILNYTKFNQTMPIRFGTKNISGMSGGSDVVLITDLSGSMSACDVNASAAPDCNGSPGIQHTRIDVAKDSDKQFVDVILGNEGQKVGLISYSSSTIGSKTVYLTDNNATLINMINTYSAGGCTCISCGIQSSTDMIASAINVTTLIDNKSQWRYSDNFLLSVPPLDSEGRNWTGINYSLGSSWNSGNAPFGNGRGAIPPATILLSNKTYPDLWDMYADKATPEVDFTTGMNSTANTFGINAGNDGWDWGAKYDYDNSTVVYGKAINGKIVFSTKSGTSPQNRCSNYDCSGGYGIEINITPEQYALISSGGPAYLSFDYAWDSIDGTFESTDEAWIKGRWTSPVSGAHYLGSELSNAGSDSTFEIARSNDPDNSISGNFVKDVSSWIEGSGTYYLDFGGKLQASGTDESGNFSFDNIGLEFSNLNDTAYSIYFRKNFTIANMSMVKKAILKVMSDDATEVYVNGALALNDSAVPHNATYWNSTNILSGKYFGNGENIVAVKLYNIRGPSRFGLELSAINDSRNKAMVVMTDGEANTLIGGSGCSASVSVASSDAINRSCFAYENYGIVSYAVGFGSDAAGSTLQAIANCGHGNYYSSNDADELKNIYKDVANSIVSYSTQAAEISGDTEIAKLFTDSFIEYNYTPSIDVNYGNISLTLESNTFANTSGNSSVESPKNGSYYIFPNTVVVDAKATSYSSDYWTSVMDVKSESMPWKNAFSLNNFGSSYSSLGDPYIVNIPVSYVVPGETNYVRINTAKNSTELQGGSPDDRIIYSVRVRGSVDYGNTFNNQTAANDDARERLSEYLSSFGISLTDIEVGSQDIGKIPWMWGPAIVALEVWK